MQCNIDARGKAVRLIWGAIALAVSIVLVGLVLSDVLRAEWWWIVAGVSAGFGVFGIFEARAGWCVVRALGFRTPI